MLAHTVGAYDMCTIWELHDMISSTSSVVLYQQSTHIVLLYSTVEKLVKQSLWFYHWVK